MTQPYNVYFPTYAASAHLDEFLSLIDPTEPVLMGKNIQQIGGMPASRNWRIILAQPGGGRVLYHVCPVATYQFMYDQPFDRPERTAEVVHEEANWLTDRAAELIEARLTTVLTGDACIIHALVTVPKGIDLIDGERAYTMRDPENPRVFILKPEYAQPVEKPEFPDGEFPNGGRYQGAEATPERDPDDLPDLTAEEILKREG